MISQLYISIFSTYFHIKAKTKKTFPLNTFFIHFFLIFRYTAIIMESKDIKLKFRPDPKLKLMDRVHKVLRYHHYAYRTEQAYSQ